MDLKQAVDAAKQRIEELFAAEAPRDVRLEGFVYDDHLMVWSLTIGFASGGHVQEAALRRYKIVRVSEADKSVLSVIDR
jgi:hypothetical protein